MDHKCSNDEAITRTLAAKAFSLAVDAAPFRPQQGKPRHAMTLAIPAARIVMGDRDDAVLDAFGQALQTLAEIAGKDEALPPFADAQGHVRPVYYPHCVHLHLTAFALHTNAISDRLGTEAMPLLKQIMHPIQHQRVEHDQWQSDDSSNNLQVSEMLWRALCALEWALLTQAEWDGFSAIGAIQKIQDTPVAQGSLHPQSRDDPPDAWVYRELTGLHALSLAAQIVRDPACHVRCRQIANFHHAHTQPDYTTYQPWALAVFAEDESTTMFAQQQLHDVQSHLSLTGKDGALLPALLLADALGQMSGATAKAWRKFRFGCD